VRQFYTAPTAIRSLMRAGDLYVKQHLRDTLRILGSVGEPINPEAWRWYHDVVRGGVKGRGGPGGQAAGGGGR
jgi:acetyl-CoA synthetase